ncbi:AAA domain-containing protein [Gammaproteobacteria bacterium]|jgi:MoxR-like ATPase|nr:AAA domain-containing protein [Gammaproteobacteria bacterium]
MAYEQIQALKERMHQSIIGQEAVVERLIIGLLANGNLLVEGLPGLAKTRAIKALARNLEADFSRIQFTPDLLPSDVTGTEVFYQKDGQGEFRFEPGPIFANIVLGDEINRAPAKVQAAMLEAMEERQVTVAGTTHKMPPLFMVMATQNPVEQEGTYPLPEAQMDRFLMHVNIEYPPVEDEVLIIDLVRGEEGATHDSENGDAKDAAERISQQAVFSARKEIAAIHVSEAMKRYMADLVYATRTPEKYSADLDRWIDVGGSPRASLALDKCGRTHAWLRQRDFVDPEDIRAVVHDCMRHRLMLSYEAQGEGVTADQVIDTLVEQVALP